MPQLNRHSPVKIEPGMSETEVTRNMNEEVENQSKYTRSLRNRQIVSPCTKARKCIKKIEKPAKRLKPTKSTRRPPRGKHEPLYEERQHMLQNAQSSMESEDQEDVKVEENVIDDEKDKISPEETKSRSFYTCQLCNKDFSSAFILCLHLQIHEKVGSAQTTEKENSATVSKSSQVSEVKVEPSQNTTDSSATSIEDTKELNTASREGQPTGILNKNFLENLKKNLSLAMNRQL